MCLKLVAGLAQTSGEEGEEETPYQQDLEQLAAQGAEFELIADAPDIIVPSIHVEGLNSEEGQSDPNNQMVGGGTGQPPRPGGGSNISNPDMGAHPLKQRMTDGSEPSIPDERAYGGSKPTGSKFTSDKKQERPQEAEQELPPQRTTPTLKK